MSVIHCLRPLMRSVSSYRDENLARNHINRCECFCFHVCGLGGLLSKFRKRLRGGNSLWHPREEHFRFPYIYQRVSAQHKQLCCSEILQESNIKKKKQSWGLPSMCTINAARLTVGKSNVLRGRNCLTARWMQYYRVFFLQSMMKGVTFLVTTFQEKNQVWFGTDLNVSRILYSVKCLV